MRNFLSKHRYYVVVILISTASVLVAHFALDRSIFSLLKEGAAFVWGGVQFAGKLLHDYHQEILGLFTIGLVIVTALLVYYTRSLWLETKTLAGDARISAEKLAAKTFDSIVAMRKAGNAMEYIAEAMRGSSAATRALVDLTQKTSMHELRPYVGVESVYFNLEGARYVDGNTQNIVAPQSLLLHLRNFGKTPAYQVEVHYTLLDEPINEQDKKIQDRPTFIFPDHRYQVIYPNQMEVVVIERQKHSFGGQTFLIYGCIKYFDPVSGMNWTLEFCRRYLGKNQFAPNGTYNNEGGLSAPRDGTESG